MRAERLAATVAREGGSGRGGCHVTEGLDGEGTGTVLTR